MNKKLEGVITNLQNCTWPVALNSSLRYCSFAGSGRVKTKPCEWSASLGERMAPSSSKGWFWGSYVFDPGLRFLPERSRADLIHSLWRWAARAGAEEGRSLQSYETEKACRGGNSWVRLQKIQNTLTLAQPTPLNPRFTDTPSHSLCKHASWWSWLQVAGGSNHPLECASLPLSLDDLSAYQESGAFIPRCLCQLYLLL